jgi:hypothetical protein
MHAGSPVEVDEQEKAMRRLSGAHNGGVFTFAEGFHAHLSLIVLTVWR